MDLFKELQTEIVHCQELLYKGYNKNESTEITWLNNFCGQFLKICNDIHKYLTLECKNKEIILEMSVLCITQTTCCIKYLEKIFLMEDVKKSTLQSSRQYFIDRILWCLARLKYLIKLVKEDVNNLEEPNFVDLMDCVMDQISPYTSYKNESFCSVTALEVLEASKQIRSTVDSLLSQALGLANIALPQQKKALTALCQKVLRECISFQEECSLNDSSSLSNMHIKHFKAVLLENALLQLEDFVNESLLKLVFKVFVDYTQFSIEKLRLKIKINPEDPQLDELIADFDVNLDRTIQIGVLAVAFAPSIKVRTMIRNCLASIESLDSCLIPSLYSQCEYHSSILEEHYYEEISKFQKAVQQIIDSVAFCTCYSDILNEKIKSSEKDFNKTDLSEVIEMGNILKEHFHINFNDLSIGKSDSGKRKYEELLLMINECYAILACAEQVNPSRILKRFKILRSSVKKIQCVLDKKGKDTLEKGNKSDIHLNSGELTEFPKMFETFGITPTKCSVFYKSKTVNNITDSLRGNYSNLESSHLRSSVKIKRRTSLRVAMFKKWKMEETTSILNTYSENSTSLQITDILDKITSLSSRSSSHK